MTTFDNPSSENRASDNSGSETLRSENAGSAAWASDGSTERPVSPVRQRRVTAGLLIALTVATLIAELVGVGGNWRLILTTAFVLLAPGWAITAYLRSAPLSFRWGVGIALGIGIGMIAGQTMVVLHGWQPLTAVFVLGLLTLAVLVHHLLRAPSAVELA